MRTRSGVRSLGMGVAMLVVWAALVAPAGAGVVPTCNGQAATIVGTDGDDTLIGTEGDDVVWLGPGNDFFGGDTGNDTVLRGT